MTTQTHTPYCLEQQIALKAWEIQWPHYCKRCRAHGGDYDPGVYRYPDGSGDPPSFEPCPNCLGGESGELPIEGEVLKCPRCGSHGISFELFEDGVVECMWCGWASGAKSDDYPPDDMCMCFLKDEDE